MGIGLTVQRQSGPAIVIEGCGQLSQSSRNARCSGNFNAHEVIFDNVDVGCKKFRYLPMLGWNKKSLVIDMKIENTAGRLFAEWNKHLAKAAITQAWQLPSPESGKRTVRIAAPSVSPHSSATRTAGNGGNTSNLGNASNGTNGAKVKPLRPYELERLASKVLPVLKQGFGVPMVTQRVEVPLRADPARTKDVAIKIWAKNGHVFDLTPYEVAQQVRQQLKSEGCSYSSSAINKVMAELYRDAPNALLPINTAADFGIRHIVAETAYVAGIVWNVDNTAGAKGKDGSNAQKDPRKSSALSDISIVSFQGAKFDSLQLPIAEELLEAEVDAFFADDDNHSTVSADLDAFLADPPLNVNNGLGAGNTPVDSRDGTSLKSNSKAI